MRSQGGTAILSRDSSGRRSWNSWLLAISLASGLPAGTRALAIWLSREGQAARVAPAAVPEAAVSRPVISNAQADRVKRWVMGISSGRFHPYSTPAAAATSGLISSHRMIEANIEAILFDCDGVVLDSET